MTKLSVNINKIATLRNSRGGDLPNVVKAALDAERFGAQGITVHPRPDQRHIRYQDVRDLKKAVTTEFNIEGNPVESFIDIVMEVIPEQVTLVPDAHDAITSDNGWDTLKHKEYLRGIVSMFQKAGIRVSIFLNPEVELVRHALDTGTDRIELYTEGYAKAFAQALALAGSGATAQEVERAKQAAVAPYAATAAEAVRLGIGVNAGHDLNLDNLHYFAQNVPGLAEVSIGHALISDAIYLGFENTVQLYLRQLKL